MNLVDIAVKLVLVGIALWVINTYIPMAASIKKILNIVVVVAVALWLLQASGVWPSSSPRITL